MPDAPVIEDVFRLPPGFRAAGVHAGIKAKPGALDMVLLVSDVPITTAAGMFTTNQVRAACVDLDIARLKKGTARAVVINSGNANACTGPQGLQDAEEMAQLTAEALEIPPSEVLVSSTGTIGKFLNMPVIRHGISMLVPALSTEAAMDAARGILTTDTVHKVASTTIVVDGTPIQLSGFCKGAGMIEPNMATMLAYLLTDAAIDAATLRSALKTAVDRSFNRISIDGDTSTNDSVICFANGRAGNAPLTGAGLALFQEALNALVFDLAMKIVRDGEGMTRFVELRVRGARDDREADIAARAVANSFLVKTGWAGTYPVWGRIIDVLGYCPAHIVPDRVQIDYDHLPVARSGMSAGTDPAALNAITTSGRFTIHMDLGTGGPGTAVLYTCDCTEEYVRINMY